MIPEILRWYMTPPSRRLPLYLILFVTYRCNSRCRTCFYHQHLNLPESADLPLDFYRRLASSLGPLAWLHLSGGEPFLRGDLAELVQLFYEKTGVRRVGIPTNGLLSARIAETTARLLECCPDLQLNVVLSLDGLEETHNALRGVPANWEKTLATLEQLRILRSRHPKRLSLNICTVLNSGNAEEIPDLFRLVRTFGVDFHDLGLLRGEFPDKSLELPPAETVGELLALADDYARRYYAESPLYAGAAARRAARVHRFINRTFLSFLRTGRPTLPCRAGDGFAVVEPNGDVRLCELTPVIGNLRDTDGDFRALWNSPAVRKIRKTGLCPEGGCTHSNFQTRNFLLNPWQWWRAWL